MDTYKETTLRLSQARVFVIIVLVNLATGQIKKLVHILCEKRKESANSQSES